MAKVSSDRFSLHTHTHTAPPRSTYVAFDTRLVYDLINIVRRNTRPQFRRSKI